jgi:amino acid transporter
MVVAFSAPITAMTGNVPVAVGWGNGIGAPAGFLVATIVLSIFSIGFTALARHITAAGAFYSFVSLGLAKPTGLAAGMLSMVAYMTMEAALAGIFSYYCMNAFNPLLGLDVPWIVYGVLAVVIISILSYRDISLASRILAVILILELALLFAMAFSVLFHGGGVDGLMLESINPVNAFSTNGVVGGSIGVGLLFAFWSWVGFESTAIYGEESSNPKKVVPRATMIAVIGIGVVYTFISWSMVAGNGAEQAVALSQSDNPMELAYAPMRMFVGEWGVTAMSWIVLGGSFACALAIHNSAARYLFAFGRDGILPKKLGRSHPAYQSPALASVVQTVIAAIILIVCYFLGVDPYGELFVLVAIMATVNLMLAQALTSAAVVNYFHIKKQHPETARWWRTLLCPIVGGIGMLYVVYQLLTNLATAAGAAAETPFGRAIPWIVAIVVAVSVVAALIWRSSKPEVYARIGSNVFSDVKPESLATELSLPERSSGPQQIYALMSVDPQATSAVLHWAADYSLASDNQVTLGHASKAARSFITSKWAQQFTRAIAPAAQIASVVLDEHSVEETVKTSSLGDLLVVSAKGSGGLPADLGAQLSRRPPCPVVVVNREGVALPGPQAPLVVSVDPWGIANPAIGFASTMAARFSAPLVLVGAYSERQQLSAYRSALPNQPTEADVQQTLTETATQVKALFPQLDVRVELVKGDPRRVLVERSQGAGALVVASRGFDAFSALVGGSVSAALSGQTDCPLILVPADEIEAA